MALLDSVRKVFRKERNPFNSAPTPTASPSPPAQVPTERKAVMLGISEPPNLSATMADVQQIQSALRMAERGDTWLLFTYYRDMEISYTHLQAEWNKRKMVVVGQSHSLIPHDKDNANDLLAAQVIQQMIDKCDNWMDGMSHLLDATLWPVAVCEKIFKVPETGDQLKTPVRFLLKKLEPVNPTLLSFMLPYIAPSMAGRKRAGQVSNPALDYDPDGWEPDLRFYSTLPNGIINRSMSDIYAPDPTRHIVHRGDILSRSIRDNFGGAMRSILFWWLLGTKDRDWFGQFMERYGSPFLKGKVDAQDHNTTNMLKQAFSLSTKMFGIVYDKKAEVELEQAATQDGANGHKTLIDVCNREVSKIVLGQELSSTAKNTGLGSGMAQFHGEVRDDIRLYDMRKLSETLRRQLFEPYLRINGFKGEAPAMIWGGKRDGDAKMLADTTAQLRQAGIRPTEEALEDISDRFGYALERIPMNEMVGAGSGGKGDNADN